MTTTTQVEIKDGAKHIAVTDRSRKFGGVAGECWLHFTTSPTVADYLQHGVNAGVPRSKLRFYLRHFVQTLQVAKLGAAPTAKGKGKLPATPRRVRRGQAAAA